MTGYMVKLRTFQSGRHYEHEQLNDCVAQLRRDSEPKTLNPKPAAAPAAPHSSGAGS
jgi:hypothetical protein